MSEYDFELEPKYEEALSEVAIPGSHPKKEVMREGLALKGWANENVFKEGYNWGLISEDGEIGVEFEEPYLPSEQFSNLYEEVKDGDTTNYAFKLGPKSEDTITTVAESEDISEEDVLIEGLEMRAFIHHKAVKEGYHLGLINSEGEIEEEITLPE